MPRIPLCPLYIHVRSTFTHLCAYGIHHGYKFLNAVGHFWYQPLNATNPSVSALRSHTCAHTRIPLHPLHSHSDAHTRVPLMRAHIFLFCAYAYPSQSSRPRRRRSRYTYQTCAHTRIPLLHTHASHLCAYTHVSQWSRPRSLRSRYTSDSPCGKLKNAN